MAANTPPAAAPKYQDWIEDLVANRATVDKMVADILGLLRDLQGDVTDDLAQWDHADAIPRLAHIRWTLVGLSALLSAGIDDTPEDHYATFIKGERWSGGRAATKESPKLKSKARRRRAAAKRGRR